MSRKRNAPPIVGRWYIAPRASIPPRLILAVANARVLYSHGGAVHRECLIATFERWRRERAVFEEGQDEDHDRKHGEDHSA